MSDPQADPVPPAPVPPPRRVVPDSEYRTAYIESYLIRMRQALHDDLLEWARGEDKKLSELLIEILEDAIRMRKS